MVDNIVTKPLSLVLIATAHMVFNGPSPAKVTGTIGSNITLQFTFNDTAIYKTSHFAVYMTGQRKIAEYLNYKCCSGGGVFEIYPANTSVLCHITNLNLNNSGIYWATLFVGSGRPKESERVNLIVQKKYRSSTVPPVPTNTTAELSGSSIPFSSHIITVLVVSPVVMLAAILPWLIWCLIRTNGIQQRPQQNCNHTVQETAEVSNSLPQPSLVYSILDFPRRPPAALEINPNDTEYAAVSYLPEKRPA